MDENTKKKIVVVGYENKGKTTLFNEVEPLMIETPEGIGKRALEGISENADAVVLLHHPKSFTLEGKTFVPRTKKPKSSLHSVLDNILDDIEPYLDTGMKATPLPDDIVAAYKEILHKKSKLSSSMRKRVSNKFNRLYKEV